MSLINVTNLTFAYDGSYDNIFEDVSFQLDTAWRLGFVGRNGRGKTTFLNLLLGKYEYMGNISSSVDFEYFPYEIEDSRQMTLDVISCICPNAEDWEIIRELALLSADAEILYRPYSTLSNGEQTKVMLLAMFLRENSFLLIDEPTNHLDYESRQILADYLSKKHGFILVSHDRAFIDRCVDHILSINRADIEVQRGNFTSWYRNRELRDNFELSENEKMKREIKHLEQAEKRTAQWSERSERNKIGFSPMKVEKSISRRAYEGAKSKKMMARSKAIAQRRESDIEEKSKLLKNLETSAELKLSPLEYYTSRLIEVKDLTLRYGDKTVCSDINFCINQGERIALRGRNGCGKSSIIKLICGENIDHDGEVLMNSRLKISYVMQDTSSLKGGLTEYAEEYGIDESLFKAILRKLDFSRIQFEKNIEDFSGGQKKKVLIARSLCEKAHLYIWDEPLNFIDVISRMQIERLIDEYKPTLLFVEHDIAFCDKIATKIVNL